MSDFRLEKSGHLTGVWKRPKFSRSVRAALGPTRLSFVTLPAALGEAFEGDHSSPMSHPNHQAFSVGKGRGRQRAGVWHFVGTTDSWCHEHRGLFHQ